MPHRLAHFVPNNNEQYTTLSPLLYRWMSRAVRLPQVPQSPGSNFLDAGTGASVPPSFALGQPCPHVELVQSCSLSIYCILGWLKMGAVEVAQPAWVSPITSAQGRGRWSREGRLVAWPFSPPTHSVLFSSSPRSRSLCPA